MKSHQVITLLAIFVMFSAYAQAEPSGKLKARWAKNETMFRMTHQGDKPWNNCKFSLNPGGFFDEGYTLKVGTISPGQVVQREFRQLTNSEGQRFNPVTHKPSEIHIWCEINAGIIEGSGVMLD
ncbi:MAG: hypothetical protein R3B95_11625 [Nitrospirales bacterium]|nr:hypothetical protein [Nitrospirales bacterium]